MGGAKCVCVCFAYISEDLDTTTHRHTEDSKPSEHLYMRPRKTLAKNAKNVMFYHLRWVSALRTSVDVIYYYEDTQVLGSISNSWGGCDGCGCVYCAPILACDERINFGANT